MKDNDNNKTQKFLIIKDRVETYRDFTINLVHYVFRYYLDKETLSLDQDIYNHFIFCFNKTCSDFLQEEIDFRENEYLIDYFYTYYYHHIYKAKVIPTETYLKKFWSSIFDVDKHKNKNNYKVLTEIYIIFDKSIKIEKNILESV
jgi:hypothetical protein